MIYYKYEIWCGNYISNINKGGVLAMAEKEFVKVKTDDLIGQIKPGSESADVFVCVLADNEKFVLARPRISIIKDENGEQGAEIVGFYRDNCKVYDNNSETLKKNYFEILE